MVLVWNSDLGSLKQIACIIVLIIAGLSGADPAPPAIPEIQAFADHEKIVLYWDKAAENSIDPETGYSDFEGYRLYRSSDGGGTWGKLWDKVFDYSGNLVGWKPFVQYDLSEKQDTSRCIYSNAYDYEPGKLCEIADSSFARKIDISGYDPLALWFNLGENTGIFRSYVDTDVIDGVEYTYAVTAYDMGLRTYEVEFTYHETERLTDCNIAEGDTICEGDTDWESEFGNGVWDGVWEEFEDIDGDGEWDETLNYFTADTAWSPSNPDHFTGQGDLGFPSFETPKLKELFTDYNANGNRDDGEPFLDENYDDVWNDRINPKNSITIKPGYHASNITFPDQASDVEIDAFIYGDSTNVGNGWRSYRVVNTDELSSGLIRFEIDACLNKNGFGDQSGSFATGCIHYSELDCAPGCLEPGPPSVYAYEVLDTINFTPKNTQDISISGISEDSVFFYKGLPGADFNTEDSIITLPDYIIENHKLSFLDDPDRNGIVGSIFTANWTEWFNGIQFRFDNGTYYIPPGNNVIVGDATISDTTLWDRIGFRIRYKTNLTEYYARPNYSYKIEFRNALIDTSYLHVGMNCDHQSDSQGNIFSSLLPIKVTNLTLNNKVNLYHNDKGIEQGFVDYGEVYAGTCDGCDVNGEEICIWGNCITRTGYKNCNWEYNENFTFEDLIYTTNDIDGDVAKLYEFKLNFDVGEYAEYIGAPPYAFNDPWDLGDSYLLGEIVYHEGMFYKAKEDVVLSENPPDLWFDSNSDNINDNPWQILYPWKDGDYIIIEPYKWFADGDAWVVDLTQLGNKDDSPSNDLNDIQVVPNPYMVQSKYNESVGGHLLRFTRLPDKCDIRIYTVTGELVQHITHNDSFDGNEWWDLKNVNGEFIAPGLYIYVVETPGGEKIIDKFAVVR